MDAVKERYSDAAQAREDTLCCPIDYDPVYLEIIPQDVLDRDYGCGDPSRYVERGETVLDLGSGGGKICFIAAQIVGPEGRVIGVDMTDDMLELARAAQPTVVERLGYDNIEFRHGHIQDLRTDLDVVGQWLEAHPVKTATDYKGMQDYLNRVRRERPLVADQSVDVVVSNCVLNLVPDHEKTQLFAEIFRALKPGGRVALSDIVSNKPSPEHLKQDPELWSGCISGALTETDFADALAQAGLFGVRLDKLDDVPWRTVEDIDYRAATFVAHKPDISAEAMQGTDALYAGPWAHVEDEQGTVYRRGERVHVTGAAAARLRSGAYGSDVILAEAPGQKTRSCC